MDPALFMLQHWVEGLAVAMVFHFLSVPVAVAVRVAGQTFKG
jgi:hypothetical protein